MTPTEAPSPSLRHLVGDAFRHWADHQRSFWLMAGPCALVITLIKAAAMVGMVNWSGLSVVIALTYILLLDQWFKQALFDNWKQRAAVLGKDKKTRRSTYASWSFIGFCLAYCVIVALATFAAVFFLTPTLFRGAFDESMMLISTLALVVVFLLAALAAGSLLLFLPARIAGLPWNVGDAYREAAGHRGRLIALAVLCTVLSLIGTLLLAALTLLPVPGWVVVLCQLIAILLDFLALYGLAFGVSRIFVATTGWRPGPDAQGASALQ
jgi:hypothetical protein